MCDWCAFGWAFLFSCGLIFSFVPSPLNPSASIGSSIPLYRTMFSSTPAQLVWSFSNTTDQTHIRSFDDSEYFIRSWAWCMSLFQSIMNISNRKRNQMRIFLSLSLPQYSSACFVYMIFSISFSSFECIGIFIVLLERSSHRLLFLFQTCLSGNCLYHRNTNWNHRSYHRK